MLIRKFSVSLFSDCISWLIACGESPDQWRPGDVTQPGQATTTDPKIHNQHSDCETLVSDLPGQYEAAISARESRKREVKCFVSLL